MSIKRKIAVLAVSIIAVLALTVTSLAAAANAKDGYLEENGVIIETTTDKDQYDSGDTAKFTIKVTNTNDYDLQDVKFQYTSPLTGNFDVKTDKVPNSIDLLKAGESKTLSFETVVTSDTAPVKKESNSTVIIIVIVAVVVIAVAAVVFVVLKKKKTAALVVAGTLIAGSLAAAMSVSAPVTANAEVSNADYHRVSVHDPSIVKDPKTGTYYIFGSHRAFAKSDDLISWQYLSTNIQTDWWNIFGEDYSKYCTSAADPKGALDGRFWAPDVIYNETMGKWCMYYSLAGDSWNVIITLLTADNIEGPYNYEGIVLYGGIYDNGDTNNAVLNQSRLEMSDFKKVLGDEADLSRYSKTSQSLVSIIDPNMQYDDDGNLWMVFGSWSAGIYMIKMDNATGFRDYNYKYETKVNESDAYYGYKLAGGFYNSGEGPYLLKTDDYYYLFVSIGNLEQSGGYNMRVYRSKDIKGPYLDENGKSAILTSWQSNLGYMEDGQKTKVWNKTNKYTSPLGIKLMGSYNMYGSAKIEAAQGHNSAFVDDDGKMYVIYHTRFANAGEGHEVRVHQLFVTETGWLAAAPYEYSGETLNKDGYTKDQVKGNYEFIVHRQDLVFAQNATPKEAEAFTTNTYKKIKINSEEVSLQIRVSWKEAGAKVTDSKGVVYAMDISLNEDGTITGDYTGSWSITEGPNVKMTIDGVEYSGVFVEQQNGLATRDMTMTFTLVGGNQCAWGVKNPAKN